MKHLFHGFLYFSFLTISFAQGNNTLSGKIDLFNQGNDNYFNIRIDAINAPTAYTDESGMFKLQFNDKKAGATVRLSVHKNGWNVADQNSLLVQIPDNPNEIKTTITLCRPNECDEALLSLYVSLRNIFEKRFKLKEAEYLKKINSLEKDIIEKQKIQASLIAEKKLLKLNNENLSRLFNNNLFTTSSLNDEVQNSLIKYSIIDSALLILNDQRIDQIYKQALLSGKKNEIEAANNNYLLKAQLLIGASKLPDSEKYYLKAYEHDSKNISLLTELGNFYIIQNQYTKALQLYISALTSAESEKNRAYIHNVLSILYLITFETDKSINHLNQSISTYRKLAIINEDKYSPFIGTQLIVKNSFYNLDNKSKHSSFGEVLQIFLNLSERSPNKYLPYLALVQIQVCLLSIQSNDQERFELVSKIEDTLSQIEDKASIDYYLLNVHYLLLKSNVEMTTGNIFESRSLVDSSLQLLERVDFGATNYTNLNFIIPNVDSVFTIEEKLSEPVFFISYYNNLLSYASILSSWTNRFGSKELLLKCHRNLETELRKATTLNPKKYTVLFVNVLSNLAVIYSTNQEFEKAFSLSKEAIELTDLLLVEEDIDGYSSFRANALLNAAVINLQFLIFMEVDKDIKQQGKKYSKEAVKIFRYLKRKNKTDLITLDSNLKLAKKIKRQFFLKYRLRRLIYN